MLLSQKFVSADSPMWLIIILILAGLGLFLFGINMMSNSLKTLAGNKLKAIIQKSTNSPIKGILVGIGITVLIQSSSGTTALVVGLVSAGLMTLPQAIGVIMGSNIGTTITSVLIGLPITDYFIAFAGIGSFVYFFGKKKKTKEIGSALFGFGLLFFGLSIMSSSLDVIFTQYKETATNIFTKFSSVPVLGLLVGTAFTALIQSSAAAIGILQTLYSSSIIPLNGALAILIGSNIGTTITAIMAAIGSTTDAKRTACVHALFNVIGALIFMSLLYPYNLLMSNMENWFNMNPAMTIAVAHIIFNLLSTFILFWFRGYMAKISCVIIKSKEQKNPIYQGLSDYSLCTKSPTLALEFTKKAIEYMSSITVSYFELTKDYSFKNNHNAVDQAQAYELELDDLDNKIHDYLIQITQVGVENADSNILSKYLDTIKDLERIGDHCSNIIEFFRDRYNENLVLSDEGSTDLKNMYDTLDLMVKNSTLAISTGNKQLANTVIEAEEKVDVMEETYRKRHILRLNKGICTVSNFDYYVDILSNLERIGDHTDNIASNVIYDDYSSLAQTGLKELHSLENKSEIN